VKVLPAGCGSRPVHETHTGLEYPLYRTDKAGAKRNCYLKPPFFDSTRGTDVTGPWTSVGLKLGEEIPDFGGEST
jgi:hypothetical protein